MADYIHTNLYAGKQWVFRGQADELPGHEAGDVLVVAQTQPHRRFKRTGSPVSVLPHSLARVSGYGQGQHDTY